MKVSIIVQYLLRLDHVSQTPSQAYICSMTGGLVTSSLQSEIKNVKKYGS